MTLTKQDFYNRWPTWFRGLHRTPEQSCLSFGIECGQGWMPLIWGLCEDIEAIGVPEGFEVHQVKEKFGGLRFYTSGCSDDVDKRISRAEHDSFRTCELCGSTVECTTEGGWIKTLCAECRRKP